MSDIIDTAREFLAYPGAGDAKGTMVAPAADIAALCRALIVRTEALRETADALNNALTWAEHSGDPDWDDAHRGFVNVVYAARRALADEPHTGQGMGDASDDAADARRFRWLLPRFTAADFEYGEPNPIAVVAFAWPRAPISADLRRSIDDAMKLEATSKAGDSTPGSLRDADEDAGNADALK